MTYLISTGEQHAAFWPTVKYRFSILPEGHATSIQQCAGDLLALDVLRCNYGSLQFILMKQKDSFVLDCVCALVLNIEQRKSVAF